SLEYWNRHSAPSTAANLITTLSTPTNYFLRGESQGSRFPGLPGNAICRTPRHVHRRAESESEKTRRPTSAATVREPQDEFESPARNPDWWGAGSQAKQLHSGHL